jgi:two-component system nitrogen regulation response regulator GlnG
VALPRALGAVEQGAGAARAGRADAGRTALIGDPRRCATLFRAIGRLAQAPLSVLITGETGTGKELVARALHRESPRARKPFVALNTAAIPAELLEANCSATRPAPSPAPRAPRRPLRAGRRRHLFLDEIGDMPLPLQTRLLRVLAEGEFFRVGGRELIRVDVRVIAATHQDLEGRWPMAVPRRPAASPSTSCACACRRCANVARTSALAERSSLRLRSSSKRLPSVCRKPAIGTGCWL